jgi:adapter protein MecA 1/2
MDIERVNENTLKLFITYRDIEDRGYSREEIWYNRAKGEELFWEVINEVNTEDYFELEGPIWIHINASEVGLEVVVTRASFNPETDISSMFQPMEDMHDNRPEPMNIEQSLLDAFENEQNEVTTFRYVFKDIDDVIPVAKRLLNRGLETSLYRLENKYYLIVNFEDLEDKADIRNVNSIIREYLATSKVTVYRLEEYGEAIMVNNCFETVVQYF